MCGQGGCTGWVYRVGIPGWVPGRAIPGYYPAPARKGPCTAKRAPEGLQGLEWVVHGAWTRHPVRPGSCTHPLGPVGPLQGPPWYRTLPRANPASWPIRARLPSFYCKVSQNRIVSPNCVEKASHSPYFQNELQKSALEILRFPFSAAFSHKELMGRFDATSDIIVKMTKCRQNVHGMYTRSGRQIPPLSASAS